MTDEAVAVLGGQRLLAGEWPYRDWYTHLTPGSYVVSAAWLAVCGDSGLSLRLLAGLISSLTGLLVHACSLRVSARPSPQVYLPWLLWTTSGINEFPVYSYHWLASLATMAAFACCLGWVQQRTPRWAGALGVCQALAFWLLQSDGLAVGLMAAAVALRFRPSGGRWFVAGAGLASLLLWLPFLAWSDAIWHDNVALAQHLQFNRNPYSWHNLQEFLGHYAGLTQVRQPLFLLAAGSHAGLNALRYATFPLLLAAAVGLGLRQRRPLLEASGWCLLGWWLASMNRLTVPYLAFLNPGWSLLAGAVLASLPAAAWWVSAAACLELVGWSARTALRGQTFVYPVSTPAGVYWCDDPSTAAGVKALDSWLQRVPRSDSLLAFPYACYVYTVWHRPNPVRWDVLPPGLTDPAAFPAARARQPDWMIYLAPDAASVAADYLREPGQVAREWAETRDFMTEGYLLQAGGRDFGLFRRAAKPPAALP